MLYICLDCLNCRVLIIAFLWSQLILQTSILRAIELSMFLTELMYVLISFNCWLIRLRWRLKWNSLLGNLHINQILVDHSNNPGCVTFGDVAWKHSRQISKHIQIYSLILLLRLLVHCIKIKHSEGVSLTTWTELLIQFCCSQCSDRLTSLQPNNNKPMCLFVL